MRYEGIAIIVLVRGVWSLIAWIFRGTYAGKETNQCTRWHHVEIEAQ